MLCKIRVKSVKTFIVTALIFYCAVFISLLCKLSIYSSTSPLHLSLPASSSLLYEDSPTEKEVHVSLAIKKEQLLRLYHGRVVRELCERILFRAVAQSNVLIVSPEVKTATSLLSLEKDYFENWKNNTGDATTSNSIANNKGSSIFRTNNGPSKEVVLKSAEEGHATQLLPSSINLNQWWNEDESSISTKSAKTNWYLLSYFISGKSPEESVDEILHPSKSSDVFNSATLTYIVIGIHSSRKHGRSYEMVGLTAVQTLLDLDYKVQLLASSHLDGSAQYRPNYLFKSKEEVRDYLSSGADIAHSAMYANGGGKGTGQFDVLLFATQGLDLAIPSRLSYLILDDFSPCKNETAGRCDSKLSASAMGQPVFLPCPSYHKRVKIQFDDTSPNGLRINIQHNGTVANGEKMTFHEIGNNMDGVEIWLGHENDVKSSEVACVRVKDQIYRHGKEPVSCTTRILRQDLPSLSKNNKTSTLSNKVLLSSDLSKSSRQLSDYKGHDNLKKERRKLNVISILIDPISRNQFKRSLPNTMTLLEKLGFAFFEKYTVVGDNSGPNQAALFTGMPLVGGRDGIKSSTSHKNDDNMPLWLWDELGKDGYVTLKVEDVCIKNSNMVQSLKPSTTHGSQLYEMFCFDFDRPNCLGNNLAAQYVLNYTGQFMTTYGNNTTNDALPWAAFLSFVDSHEDSLTLVSYLDGLLVSFLQTIDMNNTMILFSSDHGLHYGPSFYSNGERERGEPILYVHVPREHQQAALKNNTSYWVTPFDVHETILEATLQTKRRNRIGESLFAPLADSRKDCHTTAAIPQKYCDLLVPYKPKSKSCTMMVEPPSVHSFYADIMKPNRPSWPKCYAEDKSNVDENSCLCSTNMPGKVDGYWKPCNSEVFRKIKDNRVSLGDPLWMKTCKIKDSLDYTMEINITVTPKTKTMERVKTAMNQLKSSAPERKMLEMPNILFIEIDSLSNSAASRNLLKTKALLESHQIRNEQGQSRCQTEFCAAIFNKTSVIGQNSIPNQLAALSGCTDRNITNIDSYKRESIRKGLPPGFDAWCPKSELENPWLYNLAARNGYVTYFGEEFCFSQSPWVVQNLFKLNPVYHMNELFCQLAQARVEQKDLNRKVPLYAIEYDTSTNPQPCVDGRARQEIAFEYIRGIWNAYPNAPKFAYLNSLAAHDYSVDLAYQSLGTEAYDNYLSNFLEEMLDRPDAENTVIILRSDHGLQGGPSPIDFSTQVEHMNPFNSLIIPRRFMNMPKKLRSEWLNVLHSNQDKLVTGYDLYNTLRGFLQPRDRYGEPIPLKYPGYASGIPDWSFNLLHDKVPLDRNCEDARIPIEFCPCIEERSDLMPYYYVGHSEKLEEMKMANFTLIRKIDDDNQNGDDFDNDDVDDNVVKHIDNDADKDQSEAYREGTGTGDITYFDDIKDLLPMYRLEPMMIPGSNQHIFSSGKRIYWENNTIT